MTPVSGRSGPALDGGYGSKSAPTVGNNMSDIWLIENTTKNIKHISPPEAVIADGAFAATHTHTHTHNTPQKQDTVEENSS